ncbi:MAG: hypothetical protein ACK59R_14130 [Pseudomonadota bacterium]
MHVVVGGLGRAARARGEAFAGGRETIARGGQEWTPILRATPGMAQPRPQTAIAKKDPARTAQNGRIRAANGN